MPTSELTETLSQVQIKPLDLTAVLTLVLTVVVGLVLIRLTQKLLRRVLGKTKLDQRVQRCVAGGVKLALYAVLIIAVLDQLGIDPTSLVALLSVAALALALAAEDILGNMAGGLVILTSHPFAIGDYIESDSAGGTVREISMYHTKLETPEGLTVFVPNKAMAGAKVVNYTALGRRRVTRKVTASYDAATEDVKAACRAALEKTPFLLDDPAPAVYLSDYKSSSIEYTVFCWTETANYWTVHYALAENLREAFRGQGVEMTYDHLNVHMVEG